MIENSVSIIIPCYNQENYIAEAIDSILDQTCQNWECIVVNDGSTDNSKAIIERYCQKDKRITLINKTNGGVAAARNTGFKIATGEFIQFLDADDWLAPQKLEKQISFFEINTDVDIVYTTFQHYFQATHKTEVYTFRNICDAPLNEFLFYWDRGTSIPPHAPLFRRKIWKSKELPYPVDYNLRYEDWVFWVIVSLKNVRFARLDEPLVIYRIHDSNFCNNHIDVSISRLNAANYIKSIIPNDLKEDFWNKTILFVLEEYHKVKEQTDQKDNIIVKLNRRKYSWLKRIASPFLKLLRPNGNK